MMASVCQHLSAYHSADEDELWRLPPFLGSMTYSVKQSAIRSAINRYVTDRARKKLSKSFFCLRLIVVGHLQSVRREFVLYDGSITFSVCLSSSIDGI